MDAHFLGRERPIGASRVLWEIGHDGADVRELRFRLGLDSGYLSRILRSLEKQGLVLIEPSSRDRRVRTARLTAAGEGERRELDRLSDDVARGILEPLSGSQRERMLTAMREVEQLLRASEVEIAVEDPRTAAARWCFDQYFRELDSRFEKGFDPNISISADAAELTWPAGLLLIAWLRRQPVGCGALKLHAGAPCEIKRMWVAAEARGLGLGRRLLEELERRARDAGAQVVRLETNRSLTEAINLYKSNGYREVAAFNDEPYAHHWFEKRLA